MSPAIAPAAQSNHNIRRKSLRRYGRPLDGLAIHLRLTAVKNADLGISFRELRDHCLADACLDHVPVGADHHAMAEFACHIGVRAASVGIWPAWMMSFPFCTL